MECSRNHLFLDQEMRVGLLLVSLIFSSYRWERVLTFVGCWFFNLVCQVLSKVFWVALQNPPSRPETSVISPFLRGHRVSEGSGLGCERPLPLATKPLPGPVVAQCLFLVDWPWNPYFMLCPPSFLKLSWTWNLDLDKILESMVFVTVPCESLWEFF